MIRQANVDDVNILVQLRLHLLQETGNLKRNTPTEQLKEAIRLYMINGLSCNTFIAWIAEVNNVIIGTSGLVFFERPPAMGNLFGIEAYIMNMYTTPQWRGKGIGTSLLREIIGYVKGTNAQRIWLHATREGRTIYEKAGFVLTTSETEVEMELVW